MLEKQKIAITYDWIDKWGGVERVLLTLNEMFPQAEFYTSYYDSEKASWAKNLEIKTSFIQRFPSFIRKSRLASFPFYPYAFESFDFTDYDIVISVTSAFAKSIITRPGTLHICYLLTPTRYLWSDIKLYFPNKIIRSLLSCYLTKLREWDFIAAQRPDHIISISETVADRCKKYYKRNSEVIYPPFDIKYWDKIKSEIRKMSFRPKWRNAPKIIARNDKGGKYFLVVSRLEPYKRVDLMIKALTKEVPIRSRPRPPRYAKSYGQASNIGNGNKTNLVIVGEGSELQKLKNTASDNVLFLNKLTDTELGYLYNNAEALIMPQEEDFGYVSLEAQFFGCPVIAYKKGGASETVIEGKTGIFFEDQSVECLNNALRKYNMVKYRLKRSTKEIGQKNVESYSKKIFINKFKNLIKTLSS